MTRSAGKGLQRGISFGLAVLFETGLLGFAAIWAWIFREPFFQPVLWSIKATAIGTAAALPMSGFFFWTLSSTLPSFVAHNQLLNSVVQRMFGDWSIWQLAVISLCAGICEEAFFRGAVQCSLSARVGPAAALVVVSLLFGALHFLSWTYGLFAAAVGAYLGLLFIWTENLLVPMAAHGVYDFIILVYLVKIRRSRE